MKNLLKRQIWVVFLGLGILGALQVWFCMAHEEKIRIVELIIKILSFLFLIGSIAFFPNKKKNVYFLVILGFLPFLMYIIPRISYLGYLGIPSSPLIQGKEFYTHLYLLLYPGIIILSCASYRIGGGSPGNCFKIAISGVLLIFSGLLDIMWHIINPVKIPEIIPYAQHLQIFFGRPAYFREAIIFAILHIPVIVGIQFLPLDKWFKKFLPGSYE